MICSILASSSLGGIGNKGTLPWDKHYGDLAWFREWTMNQIVVMGRKTWDDPLMPKPLPDRVNFVVTSKSLNTIDARVLSGDPQEKIKQVSEQFPDKNVFVIGGKQLYEATESIVDRIYLTRMKGQYFADTRIDLEQYLSNFRIMTARPGRGCTHEIWIRTSS